ncbi:hypothetical protein KEM48_013959 [Puccinia striiformis f. sp. tritici PST-130]|nr:hypothetical protein H4Q26_015289 [Puccinia striiformis f. sp. tritici PST-130]KAI9630463.1 hypothetical protein KEM48_013959 [Puccinia striiformis f. sp. tritici PST-130]
MNNSSHSTWSEPESELTEANRRLIRTIREQYQRRTKRLNYFHQISQASMETRPPPTITDNILVLLLGIKSVNLQISFPSLKPQSSALPAKN